MCVVLQRHSTGKASELHKLVNVGVKVDLYKHAPRQVLEVDAVFLFLAPG
jgi:hypothetical protein